MDIFLPVLEHILQLEKILGTIAIVIGIMIAARLVRLFSEKPLQKFRKKRLTILKIRTLVIFGFYAIGASTIVWGIWGLSREGMIVLAASMLIALGFAFKDLAGSFISGLVLIFDGPFQVGDRIKFGDTYGDVKTLGMRATRIVTLDDSLVTIPNNLFLQKATLSGNGGELHMMVVVEFRVALHANLQQVDFLVHNAIQESTFIDQERPKIILMREVVVGPVLAHEIKAKVYAKDFAKEKYLETDLTQRVHAAFLDHNIPRPYDALVVRSVIQS
jgi:small-conductance mechanosensitive channel